MSQFDTDLKERVIKRYFILGKGFATETHAFRALAKKEIAVYAATKALPAAIIGKKLNPDDRPADALQWLFEEEWFGEGSNYKSWIEQRARDHSKGAKPLIREAFTVVSVGPDADYDVPCWEVGFDLAHPWPKESEVLQLLAEVSQ